jgi:hypothetical protein
VVTTPGAELASIRRAAGGKREPLWRCWPSGSPRWSHMGDDLGDLPVLARAGLAAAPADAAPEVAARVHWVSAHPGGHGAVRELVELVLKARDQWDAVVARHLD